VEPPRCHVVGARGLVRNFEAAGGQALASGADLNVEVAH
jgi:hypothetical protein